jgi:hypothetical protein
MDWHEYRVICCDVDGETILLSLEVVSELIMGHRESHNIYIKYSPPMEIITNLSHFLSRLRMDVVPESISRRWFRVNSQRRILKTTGLIIWNLPSIHPIIPIYYISLTHSHSAPASLIGSPKENKHTIHDHRNIWSEQLLIFFNSSK